MDPRIETALTVNRRQLFGRSAAGLGAAALASLFGKDLFAADAGAAAASHVPHFAPKAKRVVYMMQGGAPSHVDLFDFKPKLTEWRGKQIPAELQAGQRFSTMTGGQTLRPCLPEITKFARHGQSGAWVSDFLPVALLNCW